MSFTEAFHALKKEMPEEVALVVVSKTQPNEAILKLYAEGQRAFGENKVQELVLKHERLPGDIHWHMIGHLQRNKVKDIIAFVSLIHSMDSRSLLYEIEKQAQKIERHIDCLLQLKVATEDSKFGLSLEEALDLVESDTFQSLKYVKIVGVMGMASFTANREQLEGEFKLLKVASEKLARIVPSIKTLSMGMSGDYELAIAQGSTMVRLGSMIFKNWNS